jgi:AraC family transcriptional activator of mtrCDE
VAKEPLWRISRSDLDSLMRTLEVHRVRLSECALTASAQLAVSRCGDPTIYYGLKGAGCLLIDDAPPVRLKPHTLVVVPPHTALTVVGADGVAAPRGVRKQANVAFTPGSTRRHRLGEEGAAVEFVCGSFQAFYGAALALFASLATPIVEAFNAEDQLDQVMGYAMAELAAQDVGDGAMSAALLKLVLLALLRRSLISANPWVERFSILNDPPIARAFAEMTSRPSARHTIHGLSHAVGLSRSAFMARFAAAFGESPMSLLRRVRMRCAAELLAANALSIDQVALSVGYQSRSSFTRTFRRHYGSDPSDYRGAARRLQGSGADRPARV